MQNVERRMQTINLMCGWLLHSLLPLQRTVGLLPYLLIALAHREIKTIEAASANPLTEDGSCQCQTATAANAAAIERKTRRARGRSRLVGCAQLSCGDVITCLKDQKSPVNRQGRPAARQAVALSLPPCHLHQEHAPCKFTSWSRCFQNCNRPTQGLKVISKKRALKAEVCGQ